MLCERELANGDRLRYYLVDLPPTASLRALVSLAHQRWAIEQQYQELKDEIGLDHFEGRSLPGWQRHVVLTAIAYSFLQNERRRRGQTTLTLPRVRAVIQEVLTAHFFMTQPHYLKWMLKLKEVGMMPTFPSPSLKFRTVGFPQYGFKASLSGRDLPTRRATNRNADSRHVPRVRQFAITLRPLPLRTRRPGSVS